MIFLFLKMKTISLWQIIAYRMMSTASVFSFLPVIFVANLLVVLFFNLFATCWPLLNKQWISDWCSSDTWSGEVRATRWYKWLTKDNWNPWEANKLCVFTSTQLIPWLRSYSYIYFQKFYSIHIFKSAIFCPQKWHHCTCKPSSMWFLSEVFLRAFTCTTATLQTRLSVAF